MAASFNVSLKLLVNKKSKKVVYAEAGKDTVDFLCSILTLPLATVIRLLSKEGMVGCLPDLYQSIENLKDEYVQPNQHKDTVLKPMVYTPSTELLPSFLLKDVSKKKLYKCSQNHSDTRVTYNSGVVCHICERVMNSEVTIVEGKKVAGAVVTGGDEGGLVKGVLTYMVMDDLTIAPMSTITGIALLTNVNAEDIGFLEEKVVDLDMAKALKLLKVSLHSKNVLTSVFL